MAVFLISLFVVFCAIGVPIAIVLSMVVLAYFFVQDEVFFFQIIAPRFWSGMSSFELLAIPMFILSGDLLFAGKVSKALVDFANSMVGHIKGSMAIVTTVACLFFGAVSGSGPATAAAIGAVVAPEMEKDGYKKEFTAAVVTASGPLGVLIPPSILMVVYGVVTSTSIGSMLVAGIGPGIVFAIFLVAYEIVICRKRGYGGNLSSRFSFVRVLQCARDATWALLVPVIILGGIYSGMFTPTEAAGVAVVYSLFIGLFILKTIKAKDLWGIFLNSAITTSTIMFVMAGVSCLSYMFSREQIPEILTMAAMTYVTSPILFMLICNVILFFAGMIENGSACVLLLAPLMYPVAMQYGIDPVYFGTVMVANLAVGMMTPPVAATLYVAARVSNVTFTRIIPEVVPFVFVLLCALAVVVAFPQISLYIPTVLFG